MPSPIIRHAFWPFRAGSITVMHALFAPAPSDMIQDLMSTMSVDAIYYKLVR
jgi:hypothetical protein